MQLFLNKIDGVKEPIREIIKIKNDLKKDVEYLKSQGVGMIINLLGKYDLRVIGIEIPQYQAVCASLGIKLIFFPVIEMMPPTQSPEELDSMLISTFFIKFNNKQTIW